MRRRSFVVAILGVLALPIPDTTRWRFSLAPGIAEEIDFAAIARSLREAQVPPDEHGTYTVWCHPTRQADVERWLEEYNRCVDADTWVAYNVGRYTEPAFIGADPGAISETIRAWGFEPLPASRQFDMIDDNAPWFREHRGMRYWMRRGYGRTFA